MVDNLNTMTSVVDRSKVCRERSKTPEEYQDAQCFDALTGLYFDGRKDTTLINAKKEDGKHHKTTIVGEHIAIVGEPDSTYYAHVTPEGGTSKNITKAIVDCMKDKQSDLSQLVVVGCDGTYVNTGRAGGVIRLLEIHVKRPLQWFVCLLHANELPLRHLIQALDGAMTGPTGFSGDIGKNLKNCEDLFIVKFAKIKSDLPAIDPKELSTYQRYLLEICQAVSNGHCPIDLSLCNPGLVNHSRWLTTANRLVRLYVSTKEPSDNLIAIVTFILTVYAPVWFTIKKKSSCKDGARHVFNVVSKSRYLPDNLKKVVDPVIQRNSYFAHPENILLAMMTDDRSHIRELALRRIMKARKAEKKTQTVRQFKVCPLNFNCTEYTELINWASVTVTEPPVTKFMTNEDLESFINSPITPVINFERYPCHTQAVERCIKLVTEASKAVCGQNRRDGFIRTRLAQRNAKF